MAAVEEIYSSEAFTSSTSVATELHAADDVGSTGGLSGPPFPAGAGAEQRESISGGSTKNPCFAPNEGKCEGSVRSNLRRKGKKILCKVEGGCTAAAAAKQHRASRKKPLSKSKKTRDTEKGAAPKVVKVNRVKKVPKRKLGDYFVSFLCKMKATETGPTTPTQGSCPSADSVEVGHKGLSPRPQAHSTVGLLKGAGCAVNLLSDPVLTQRFHVSLPLSPTRVREIFSRHVRCHASSPVLVPNTYSTVSSFGNASSASGAGAVLPTSLGGATAIDSGDTEALSCFFPAVHFGEWFSTANDFIEHCASVSHKLLCEDEPLFPLIAFKPQRKRFNDIGDDVVQVDKELLNHPTPKEDEKLKSVCSEAEITHLEGVLHGSPQKKGQCAYTWWFMRVHMAAVQFGRKDWDSAIVGSAKAPVNDFTVPGPGHVGELWCGWCFFVASVARGVAKRMVLAPQMQWHVIRAAAIHVTHVVRDAYVSLPQYLSPAGEFHRSDDDVMYSFTTHAETGFMMDAKAHSTAMRASCAVLATSGVIHVAFSGNETRYLAALSVHIAGSIAETIKQMYGLSASPRVMRGTAYPLDVPSTATASGTRGAGANPLTRCVVEHYISDGAVSVSCPDEERIMSLVLWMYLHDEERANLYTVEEKC